MAITVVQSTSASSFPVSFGSAVTAGNTVFIVAAGFTNTGGQTITTSAPTLGGSSVPGATAFFDPGVTNGVNSPSSGAQVYAAAWMLPNCPGGSTAVGITMTGDDAEKGAIIWEVSGLGTSPAADKTTFGRNTNTSAVDSGSTGAITASPEFIFGCGMIYQGASSGPGSGGWTHVVNPTGNCWTGYQIATSSGGSYDWAQTGSANGPWVSFAVTVEAPVTAIAGTVQPASTFPTLRRKPSRAVVQFTPVVTVNTGHGPAGRAQPLAASLIAPRRKPSRAVVGFIPVTTTNGPAKPHPQHGTPSSDEARGWKRWLLWGP